MAILSIEEFDARQRKEREAHLRNLAIVESIPANPRQMMEMGKKTYARYDAATLTDAAELLASKAPAPFLAGTINGTLHETTDLDALDLGGPYAFKLVCKNVTRTPSWKLCAFYVVDGRTVSARCEVTSPLPAKFYPAQNPVKDPRTGRVVRVDRRSNDILRAAAHETRAVACGGGTDSWRYHFYFLCDTWVGGSDESLSLIRNLES